MVFNDGLRVRREAHAAGLPYVKDTELQKQVITRAKRTEERAWLSEVSSVVLVQSLRDLHTAYRNFFTSLTGERRGPRIAEPRFKSKRDGRQAIRLVGKGFALRRNGRLHVAKVGELVVRWSRDLPSSPTSVTVMKDAANRYRVSFVVDVEPAPLPATKAETGIDLGLAHFAVFADGRKVESPRFLRRAENKLARMQKAFARKVKGSRNRAKARIAVAKWRAHVADQRRDWHHKLSTTVIRDNQAVFVEDLAVRGLARTRLAKSVHDAGWSAFLGMLQYKAMMHGRRLGRIGRFEPTSQVCSDCGAKDGPKPLSVRRWVCVNCRAVHDRDVNAARNILAAGRADRLNACGARIRPGVIPAPRAETGTVPARGRVAGIPGNRAGRASKLGHDLIGSDACATSTDSRRPSSSGCSPG
ncbi:transposase [Actinorhabdospora filicis]|uniref:Transposase n=1 Tax=Actinorhabdospora filicis TaxID=1785913 RepID=A0A9W6SS20_9ACTN|nr:transposase [Actinorhabdospora filicis]